MEITHDPRRDVLLVKVVFRDICKLKLGYIQFVTVEGHVAFSRVEPRLCGPSVVASQSARRLKVPSSHLWRRRIAFT